MLTKVFESDPLLYLTYTTYGGDWFIQNLDYHANIAPWVETIQLLQGTFVCPVPTLQSPTSIYLLVGLRTSYWPSWAITLHQFDGTSGTFISRVPITSNVGTVMLTYAFRTRLGKLFWRDGYSGRIWEFALNATTGFDGGQIFYATDYQNMIMFGQVMLDETADILANAYDRTISIYRHSTGAFLYSLDMPVSIIAVTLEDSDRMYILCQNRTLILLDYVRGEVLGIVKVPKTPTGSELAVGTIVMTWDSLFRRLLVFERVPDNPDGSCASKYYGYRMVPQATRLTSPIPLKVPRKGRTIPAMVQVLGDLNEGVGGGVITATVTGDGQLVGIPVTDNVGRALIQVRCLQEGEAAINCTYEQPDEVYLSPPELPPTPGPGDGEGEGSGLPATAPERMDILQQVYNSRSWRLGELYEDEPDGRGAFTEAAVNALHAADARFGHVKKNPGQNQYNGHAVDAINFLCDDGVTGEVYDIVSGSGGPTEGSLTWNFCTRDTTARSLWYF